MILDHTGITVSDIDRSRAFYSVALTPLGVGAAMEVEAPGGYVGLGYGKGGKDNGPPGLRPHYHPHYYGAFVFDPDGRNVEAVCHHPA